MTATIDVAKRIEELAAGVGRQTALLRMFNLALEHGATAERSVHLQIQHVPRGEFDQVAAEACHFPGTGGPEFWTKDIETGGKVRVTLFCHQPPPVSVFSDDFFDDEDGLTRRQREMA
jgi:hypothetical protein